MLQRQSCVSLPGPAGAGDSSPDALRWPRVEVADWTVDLEASTAPTGGRAHSSSGMVDHHHHGANLRVSVHPRIEDAALVGGGNGTDQTVCLVSDILGPFT